MEDSRTSEEEDTDSQDSNIPVHHGNLPRNCWIKIIMLAVQALITKWHSCARHFGLFKRKATGTTLWSRAGVFNLLNSRTNLHRSYNTAGRSHYRLQNHHGYIKHHHRSMGVSPGDVGEVPMTYVKQRTGCRMSCDVGKAAEGLENESHSPTLTSLHLRHSSFSNPSATLPTSQLILQPFRCFTYIIGTSLTSPGELPIPYDDV